MELAIGQKVAYPNQGVCLVEDIEKKQIGENQMSFYSLRVLSDNSTIFGGIVAEKNSDCRCLGSWLMIR